MAYRMRRRAAAAQESVDSGEGALKAEQAPRIRTSDLFGASRRVVLEHRGQEYVLLITRNGGLVLNRWS